MSKCLSDSSKLHILAALAMELTQNDYLLKSSVSGPPCFLIEILGETEVLITPSYKSRQRKKVATEETPVSPDFLKERRESGNFRLIKIEEDSDEA